MHSINTVKELVNMYFTMSTTNSGGRKRFRFDVLAYLLQAEMEGELEDRRWFNKVLDDLLLDEEVLPERIRNVKLTKGGRFTDKEFCKLLVCITRYELPELEFIHMMLLFASSRYYFRDLDYRWGSVDDSKALFYKVNYTRVVGATRELYTDHIGLTKWFMDIIRSEMRLLPNMKTEEWCVRAQCIISDAAYVGIMLKSKRCNSLWTNAIKSATLKGELWQT